MTDLVTLSHGGGNIWGALLELHGVRTCNGGDVNEFFGDVNVTVVVDSDFPDDVHGLSAANELVSDSDRGDVRFDAHVSSLLVVVVCRVLVWGYVRVPGESQEKVE